MNEQLVPLLVVQGAAQAIDYYVKALGAEVTARYEHGPERYVGHAELSAGEMRFAVTEQVRAMSIDAPPSLGGSPVVLTWRVADAEAAVASMCAAGGELLLPLQELFGERMARVRDPFGHLWIVSQRLRALPTAEIQRQRDALYAEITSTIRDIPPPRQAPLQDAPPPSRASIHLIIGPVGAGKSTLALDLAREHNAIRLTLDEWMARLFRPDRPDEGLMPWYAERAARCIEQIWSVATGLLAASTPVILEIGLLRRSQREVFYQRLDTAGCAWTLYVLDADREVRRVRVEERNRTQGATFSMVVPPAIFELASDLWEPPEPDEHPGADIRFIHTDRP